jgi:hypothetical protein
MVPMQMYKRKKVKVAKVIWKTFGFLMQNCLLERLNERNKYAPNFFSHLENPLLY